MISQAGHARRGTPRQSTRKCLGRGRPELKDGTLGVDASRMLPNDLASEGLFSRPACNLVSRGISSLSRSDALFTVRMTPMNESCAAHVSDRAAGSI